MSLEGERKEKHMLNTVFKFLVSAMIIMNGNGGRSIVEREWTSDLKVLKNKGDLRKTRGKVKQ